MDLYGFFKQNAVQPEIVKYAVSKRFLDRNKKPIEWEVRPITTKKDESLREQATVRKQIKLGQYKDELDTNKYAGLLAVACTVQPNLHDESLQNSYGVMGADELLKTMLLPGEYAVYVNKIQEICGFDKGINEIVEQAKN